MDAEFPQMVQLWIFIEAPDHAQANPPPHFAVVLPTITQWVIATDELSIPLYTPPPICAA
ncbi:MAG: hypothetical protein AMJ65_15265 [Phycisphaerae bacterium SG8_4]|nr:MAG: hypothetical protein AMJ65_15265 [Phycisphaerae bacterium SG8_4]